MTREVCASRSSGTRATAHAAAAAHGVVGKHTLVDTIDLAPASAGAAVQRRLAAGDLASDPGAMNPAATHGRAATAGAAQDAGDAVVRRRIQRGWTLHAARDHLNVSIDGAKLMMLLSAVVPAVVSMAWQAPRVKLHGEPRTMKAFDSVFLEVASRETRALHLSDRRGRTTGTWLFREFYCNDPRCDCRRVMILVEHVETQQIVAAINYGFEPSTRRDEPQLSLDPLNPQSELSDDLLELFADMIAKDHAYRRLLLSHYIIRCGSRRSTIPRTPITRRCAARLTMIGRSDQQSPAARTSPIVPVGRIARGERAEPQAIDHRRMRRGSSCSARTAHARAARSSSASPA